MIKDKEDFTVMLVSHTIKAVCCYQSACPSACSINTCINICSQEMNTRHCPAHCWRQCQWAMTAGWGQWPSEKPTRQRILNHLHIFTKEITLCTSPWPCLQAQQPLSLKARAHFKKRNTLKRINITHFDEQTGISNLYLVPQWLIPPCAVWGWQCSGIHLCCPQFPLLWSPQVSLQLD